MEFVLNGKRYVTDLRTYAMLREAATDRVAVMALVFLGLRAGRIRVVGEEGGRI